MSSFSVTELVKMFETLSPTPQSIQTVALWMIRHRKHHSIVVKVWHKELVKASEKRKIIFIHLANDVIQNSKKKGPEFCDDFFNVLPKAFHHIAKQASFESKLKKNVERVLNVWKEREIYNQKQIAIFTKALARTGESSEKKKTKEEEPQKKQKPKRRSSADIKKQIVEELSFDVFTSPKPPGEPPDTEELINSLVALENSASSDAEVREEIVSLPPEVSDPGAIENIKSKTQARELSKRVMAADELTSNYNGRLSTEWEARKKMKVMLKEFTESQNELLVRAKRRLKEYREKLVKVHQLRQEMRSHLQNLPDLTKLPDVTGGLAPLPSAGDLFNVNA